MDFDTSLLQCLQDAEDIPLNVNNYRQQLDVPIISAIDNRIADNYVLEDMIDFINQYGANNFCKVYEEYVETLEEYPCEVVGVFIEEFGIQSVNYFDESYRGKHNSKTDYAKAFVKEEYRDDIPGYLEVDWEATFDNLDVVITQGGYVFYTRF